MAWFLLLALVVLGAALANRASLPEAVAWCLLGLAVAFVPGFPEIQFNSAVALYVILPPLVYASAVELPWPEFRDNLRPIGVLALGLVAASTAAVAATAHALMHLPWAMAIVLGAVTSPTDPVAASAVASRVGMPRRLVAILEGEGLLNDSVSLTIFRLALAAAGGAAASPAAGLGRFAAIVIAEPVYGWLLGVAVAWLRSRIADPRIEIAVTLLTPFAAYLPAQWAGVSGILAPVATGMYIGERRPTLVPAGTRLHATSFWQMVVFLLNGVLFLAAGMELRAGIASSAAGAPAFWWGGATVAVVVGARLAWCAATNFGLRAPARARRLPARHLAIVAWAGARGPISLAAALSIPASTPGLSPATAHLVLYITSVVIVFTLLLQGLSLPHLVRWLAAADARADQQRIAREERLGEAEAARAALELLDRTAGFDPSERPVSDHLRRYYELRLAGSFAPGPEPDGQSRLHARLLAAERARVLQLRREGRIGDYAAERLQRSFDLRESLLD